MTRWINSEARQVLQDVSGERIEQGNAFDFIVEHGQPYRHFGIFRREDIEHITAYAKHATFEFHFIALVLHLDQALDGIALRDFLALMQMQNHAVVIHRIANTVDRRYGRDDDRILALQQRLGGGKAHLLNMLIDRRILLDEGIARRHIGFRLIVVVIRDEILDRIFRKKLAHFRIQLRRQRLIRRHDDGRTTQARNDIGHGVGLARARHAEQGLIFQAILKTFGNLGDGLGLITRRLERLVQSIRAIGECRDQR